MSNNPKNIEYQMTKKMYNAILGLRKENEMNENPYTFVMNYINNEFGLRGTIKQLHVLVEGY